MTFLEMEMKEIDRNTCNDTNNITSLISTRLKYVLDISKTEQAFTVEEYKHTHTNTHTHKHPHAQTVNIKNIFQSIRKKTINSENEKKGKQVGK